VNKVSLSVTFALLFLFSIVHVDAQDVAPLIDTPGKTIGSDFNGDGIDDFIVGAGRKANGIGAGQAYIFFGASDLSGTKSLGGGESADVTFFGKGATDRFGREVAGVGDVNADGIPDIGVGAYKNNDGGTDDTGAVYIFFGATDLSGTKDTGNADEDVRIIGKANNDYLGKSIGGGRNNPGP